MGSDAHSFESAKHYRARTAVRVFSKEKVERILEIVFRLDEVSDTKQLTHALTPKIKFE